MARVRCVVVLMCFELCIVDLVRLLEGIIVDNHIELSPHPESIGQDPDCALCRIIFELPKPVNPASDMLLAKLAAFSGLRQHSHDLTRYAQNPSVTIFDVFHGRSRPLSTGDVIGMMPASLTVCPGMRHHRPHSNYAENPFTPFLDMLWRICKTSIGNV
jgi:hypothetical protein